MMMAQGQSKGKVNLRESVLSRRATLAQHKLPRESDIQRHRTLVPLSLLSSHQSMRQHRLTVQSRTAGMKTQGKR